MNRPQQPQRHSARLNSEDNLKRISSSTTVSNLLSAPSPPPPAASNSSHTNLNSVHPIKTSSSSKANRSISSSKRSHHHSSAHRYKPAELYRTDFITAMKLPDTELLDEQNYWLIRDTWRLEWEKGVQVPVKADALPRPNFKPKPDQYRIGYNNCVNNSITVNKPKSLIKMPKKYLCPANDKNYKPSIHDAYITHGLINDNSLNSLICRYDCDEMDLSWLNRVNYEFEMMGLEKLSRVEFERIVENFETQSFENLKHAIEKLESYSIEYDEGIVCDVCHSPDSEESNEMVFCDGCNMCVHQACYGIEKIPQGNWLCAPCQFGGSSFKPECVLCPNMGGAMKATKNFRNWAHVNCALWIPETGFGNPDRMEPIVNLNQILAARWQLVCGLCKEKRGCCLQCSEKRCHAAFHVTCAYKHSLEMQTISNADNEENIVFKAYCSTHTKKRQLAQQRLQGNEEYEEEEDEEEEEESEEEGMEDEDEEEEEQETTIVNAKNNQTELTVNDTNNNNSTLEVDDSDEDHSKFISSLGTMNEKERKLQIIKRVHMLKDQFYKNISLNYTQTVLGIKHKAYIDFTFGYWKLKRRFNKTSITLSGNRLAPTFNRALMLPRGYEQDLLNRSEHQLIARVKMFVKLRQDLEKVRNLCYMTVKREKLKKQLFEINQHLFEKQADYIARYSNSLSLNLAQPSVSAGSSARSGRLRDILQTKSENCVYDYPELWIVNEFKEIQENAATAAAKASPTKDKNKLANVENLANLSLKSGSELDESNSNKENDLSLASSKKAKTKSERKTSKKLTSHSSTSANTATSNNNKLLTKRIKNKYNLMSRNKKRLQSNNVNSLDQESNKKLKTATAASNAATKPKLASADLKLNPLKANGRLSSPLKRLNGEQSDLYEVNKSYDSLDSSDSSNGNRKRRRTDKHALLSSNASSSESLAKNRIRFSSRINGTSNK